MKRGFDKQAYRRELIDAGFEAEDAEVIASRTAEERRRSAREPFQAVGSLLNMSKLNREQAEQERPALPASSPALQRSSRLEGEAAGLAKSMTIDTRGTMTNKKRNTAGEALSKQVSDAKQASLLKHTKQQMKDMQLTLFDIAPWPDTMRAMPNDTARSALFTTRNKKTPREALQNKVIFHVNKDVRITYTGLELRADDDELVWQQVLEYAKRTPIGEPITFTFYELCQDLGWSINGRYYTKAEECLSRLQATAMAFTSDRIGHLESVSLLHRFRVLDRGKKTSRCQVLIDEEIVVLFAGEHYTKFIWEKYRKLSPTARRMFDYFSTHREPYPLKLETFRLMCGSDSTRVKKWREQVGEACQELHESGLVETAWVHEDLVHCKR
ncbi:transcriptional regulator [Salmonella enterica]|nr:transcriptional regulator [Salmonella enterica]